MTNSQYSHPCHFSFQCLTDFFMAQGSMGKDSKNRVETHEHFGLLPGSYLQDDGLAPSWHEFAKHIERLNQSAPEGVSYKVLFVTRHGQGFHNITQDKYGTEEWDRKWSLLDGNDTITWADAELTEKGRLQAHALGQIWGRLMQEQRIPFPSLYTSPLRRCLDTTRTAFEDLAKSQGQPFQPIVKEFLRERLGRHTCNRRSTKSWIQEHYPTAVAEPGFSELDVLFDPDAFETFEELRCRQQALLEDLFTNETSSFVSLAMHTLAAQQLMLAINHELVRLAPAATMAFFVKAEQLPESASSIRLLVSTIFITVVGPFALIRENNKAGKPGARDITIAGECAFRKALFGLSSQLSNEGSRKEAELSTKTVKKASIKEDWRRINVFLNQNG